MADPIAGATVEVTADLSGLSKSISAGLKKVTDTVTKQATDAGKAYGDALTDSATSAVNKGASQVAEPLARPIEQTTKQVAATVGRNFADLGKTIKTEFANIGKTAAKALGSSQIGQAAAKVKQAITTAFSTATKAVQSALAPIGKTAQKAFSTVTSAAAKVGGGVQSALSKVQQSAAKAFAPIGKTAQRAFSAVQSAAARVVAPVQKALNSAVGQQVQKSFSRIGQQAAKAFGSLPGLAQKAASGVGTALGKLPGIAQKAASGVSSAFSKVGSSISSVFSKASGTATASMSKISAAGSSMAGKVGSSLGGLVGKFAAVGTAALGVGAAMSKGFTRLTDIESASAKLTGLGNSAKDVKTIMDNALASVKGTAFGMGEAATTAASAVAAGIAPGQELQKYLRGVADAAQIAGVDMAEMGSIFNSVTINGKAMTQDIQQIADRGIPIWTALAKEYGVSAEKMAEMVSKGEVDAKTFQKVMHDMVGGSAEAAADTTIGAFKNMGAALGRVGASFLQGTFPYFKKTFTNITKLFDAIAPKAEALGKKLGEFLKPAMKAFNQFTDTIAKGGDFSGMLAGLTPVMTIIKALVPVLTAFGTTFKAVIQDQLKGIGEALSSIDPGPITNALTAIGNAAIIVVRAFGKIDLGKIIGPLAQAFVSLAGVVAQIMPPIMTLISALGDSLGKILPVIAQSIGMVATALGGALGDVLKAIMPSLTTFVTILADTLAQVLPLVAQLLAVVVKVLAQGLAAALPPLLNALGPLVQLLGQALLAVLPPLIKLFQDWGPLITMNAKLTAFLATAVMEIVSAFVAVVTGTKTFRQAVSDAFSAIAKAFQPIVDAAQWVYDKLFGHSIFPDMLDAMTGWVKDIGKVFSGVWTKIKETFSKIKNWVSGAWKNSWANVAGWMSGAVQKGRDKITGIWSKVQDRFTNAKNWTRDSWRKAWSNVSEWMSGAVAKGRDKISGIWQKTREKFTAARKWVGSSWKNNWSKVSTWMSDAVKKGRDKVGDFWKGARGKFSDARAWVKNTWKPNWSSVEDWMKNPVKNAKAAIEKFLGKEGVRKALIGFVTAADKIMNGLKKVFGAPVQWVVNNAIRPLAQAAAKVGEKVGITIPVPNEMSLSYATGGVVPGYSPGVDNHIAAVSGGEGIVRPEFTRAVGENWIHQANAASRSGGVAGAKRFLAEQAYGRYMGAFASGGIVQPVPGRGNRHTSGYSWATWAGDFPNPIGTPVKAWKDGIVAAVKYLTTSYGQHVRVNHSDGSSSLYAHMSRILVDVGDKLSAGQTLGLVGSTGNSTGPHLHFETMNGAYNGGTGAAEDTETQGFLSKIKNLMTVTLPDKFGSNTWTKLLTAVPKTIGKAALDKLTDLVAQIGDGVMSAATWVGAKVAGLDSEQRNNAAVIIDVAKKLGFGDRGAIIGLITALVESGLRNVNYGDRDSLGLFQQRAPWGSAADRTNPSKSASMFFLGGQTGQPGLKDKAWRTGGYGALAQAVQVSAFPGRYSLQVPRAKLILAAFKGGKYDNGGWVPPGISVMENRTGRKEPQAVFTAEQWKTLHDIARGRQRSPHGSEQPIQIHLHGVIDSASAAREIEQLLIGRGRTVGGVNLPSRSRKLVRGT